MTAMARIHNHGTAIARTHNCNAKKQQPWQSKRTHNYNSMNNNHDGKNP